MSSAIETAIYTALNVAPLLAAAPGGVHNGIAPPGTAFPYVVFDKITGDHQYLLGGPSATPALSTLSYRVKAIDASLSKEAAQAALAIADGLLNGIALVVSGATTLYCQRLRDVDYDEPGEGVTIYQHVGHEYDIVLDPN